MESEDKTIEDVVNSMNEKQKKVLAFLVKQAEEAISKKHIKYVIDSMNEEQKKVLAFLVGMEVANEQK